jgi:DNA-binding transcriptional regulator YdaS (Cro superfamily)
MTVIEKERVAERPSPEVPAPKRRLEVAMWILAVIAVAAVAAAAILLTTGGEEASTEAAPVQTAFRTDQQKLADLANQGYIPAAAVDWELLRTEQLVNEGLIPAQTLEPRSSAVEPLFSAEERLMIELARTGQIPREAVDWGEVQLKKMVNEGMIPREALND